MLVIFFVVIAFFPLQLSLKSEKVHKLARVVPRGQVHHVPRIIQDFFN